MLFDRENKIKELKMRISDLTDELEEKERQIESLYFEKKKMSVNNEQLKNLKKFKKMVESIINARATIVDKYDNIKELVDNWTTEN